MKTISIAALKDRLSEQIRATAAGEEIVITSHGHPVAKLTAYATEQPLRVQRPTRPVAMLRKIAGIPPLQAVDVVALLREDRDAR